MQRDNTFRIAASTRRTATIVFLHGLGQTNVAWRGMIEWMAAQLPSVEWVLPQAAPKPVSLNAGQYRPSWFDMATLPPGHAEWDEHGVAASVAAVEAAVLAEVHRGVDARRIVLMGFSQGAALGLLVALTTLHELGGVVSLSGWIPQRGREQIVHTEPHLPVFWGHGRSDAEIPLHYAEEAMAFLRDVLRLPTALLTLRRYDGLAHTVNGAEMYDVVLWLQAVLRLPPAVNGQ